MTAKGLPMTLRADHDEAIIASMPSTVSTKRIAQIPRMDDVKCLSEEKPELAQDKTMVDADISIARRMDIVNPVD